jgi:hypothetical protein
VQELLLRAVALDNVQAICILDILVSLILVLEPLRSDIVPIDVDAVCLELDIVAKMRLVRADKSLPVTFFVKTKQDDPAILLSVLHVDARPVAISNVVLPLVEWDII